MIATPAYGEIFYAPYVQSVLALARLAHKDKWDFMFESLSYAEISEARNYLVTRFFDKTDATHLLFVDADMGFPAKLVTDMLAIGKPVVGVIYPKRQIDLKRVADLARSEPDTGRAIAKAHQFVARRLPSAGSARTGFIEVEACGAGVLLIERGCIEALLRKAPKLSDEAGKGRTPLTKDLPRLIRAFDPLVKDDGGRLSEDYAFCHRWRSLCGGEVWANVAHEITHVGLHHFAARYSDAGPVGPHIFVGPKTGKMITGQLRAAGDANVSRETAEPAGKRAAPKRLTVRLRERGKAPRTG
jgi:hypothetical protein